MQSFVYAAACTALFTAGASAAEPISYDFVNSTPIGSWQLREVTTTNHKGRQSVSMIRSSLVGKEQRDGAEQYWIEMELDNFKITRKGDRKADGETSIIKVLVDREALEQDLANAANNLTGFAREIILQTGDADPIAISEGGMFANMMMQAIGLKVSYDYTETGREAVEVPAGDFEARRIEGSGSVEAKILFKTIRVESETTTWMSEEVPFGIVKMTTNSLVNGKAETAEAVLLEYGMSGAESKITKPPMTMPGFKNPLGGN